MIMKIRCANDECKHHTAEDATFDVIVLVGVYGDFDEDVLKHPDNYRCTMCGSEAEEVTT